MKNKTVLTVAFIILWIVTPGKVFSEDIYEDIPPSNMVKTFFCITTKNATPKLYLNGKELPWLKTEQSFFSPGGILVIQHTASAYINEAENIIGITAVSTGNDPGIRVEVSRKETDTKWKTGTPSDDNWLKKGFNDNEWRLLVPENLKFDWLSKADVNSSKSYVWGNRAEKEIYLRQIIRGVEKPDQNIKYTTYDWGKVREGLGYHRALVYVSEEVVEFKGISLSVHGSLPKGTYVVPKGTYVVWSHIPWRRRDANPEQKAIFIHDSKTGKRIDNFDIINLNQEYLDVVFEPQTIPGEYEIYYLPYFERFRRPFYWNSAEKYVKPYSLCDENWLAWASFLAGNQNAAKLKIADGNWQRLPEAELMELQSRTEFDSFYPMEVPATNEELSEIIKENSNYNYLIFPEDRKYPIKMFETLPLKWIKEGPFSEFKGEAQPGEYYCYQIGVYAMNSNINNIDIKYDDLKNGKNLKIPASEFQCINTNGVDRLGKPFEKTFNLLKGKVRPLWIGFQIPDNAKGEYTGTITITPEGMEPTTVKININVSGELIVNKGDDEPWRYSRLRWLDSTMGLDDNELVPPYTPLKVSHNQIQCLNRNVLFGNLGMPQKITSNGKDVLSTPIKFNVITDNKEITWEQGAKDKILLKKQAKVIRESAAKSKLLKYVNKTTMEADGMILFEITLTPIDDISLDAIIVEVPFNEQTAKYSTGGTNWIGGFRPEKINWEMSPNFKLWTGDYDAGMQVNFISHQTKGSMIKNNNAILLKGETGNIALKKSEDFVFSFRLFITPFKPINKKIHFTTRTSESYKKIDEATIVHFHHGRPENPWINYPFLEADKLAAAQKNIINRGGIGIQLYYTIRELTNRTVELWALRSLGNEIFTGIDVYNTLNCPTLEAGHPWLREHLVNGFTNHWPTVLAPGVVDQAIGNKGSSRWSNYYIEGLNWLIRKGCIASLYIDGIGYDREIMKRVSRSLSRENPEYRIEFHYYCRPGEYPGSSINREMEHMPYFTKLWFGENFNYNLPPDYWFVEISGIPFGITGEMLNDTGTANSWRSMIYGMTGRGLRETPAIYDLWDNFGIPDAEWIGYWNPDCPVKTGRDNILATVYKKKGKSLICIASWAEEDVNLNIIVDWKMLGLDPSKTVLKAPDINDMQTSRTYKIGDSLPVKKAQGLVLIAEENSN